MKANFKQISRKALSVVVAVLLVASCFAISLTVFAETTPFAVPSASPAIPLVNGKGIELSNLSIEIGGKYVSGATLTWSDPFQGSSAVIIGGKLIGRDIGLTGFTVSDASGNKQNVWAFVNEAGDLDYSFVNSDFNDATTFDLNDWVGAGIVNYKANDTYISGGFGMWSSSAIQPSITAPNHYDKTTGATVSSNTLKVPTPPNGYDETTAMFYRNKALKDFADYTVETTLGSVVVNTAGGQGEVVATATGIIVRAALTDDVYNVDKSSGLANQKALSATENSLFLRIRNYGGLSIAGLNQKTGPSTDPAPYFGKDQATAWHTAPALEGELWKGKDLDKTKVLLPAAQSGSAVETLSDIKVELKGKGIKYTINGNVVFDTIAQNDLSGMYTPIAADADYTLESTGFHGQVVRSEYPDTYATESLTYQQYLDAYDTNLKATKGTVGFCNNVGILTHVSTFKVTPANLISFTLPAMVDVTVDKVYNVTTSSPAIPLYVGKSLALNLVSIELPGGNAYTGDKLTWERTSGNAARIVEGKLVGMFEGQASFNVSDGTKTQRVWVIVNKQGDSKFYLLNLDFTKEGAFKESDWLQGMTVKATSTDGDKEVLDTGKYARLEEGVLTQTTVKTATGDTLALEVPMPKNHGEGYAAIYKNTMLFDFPNYNINAKVSNQQNDSRFTHNMSAAPGILARVDANFDAKVGEDIFTDIKSMSFRFRNYGGLGIFGIATYDKEHDSNFNPNVDFDGDGRKDWANCALNGNSGFWTAFSEGTIDDYYRPSNVETPGKYIPENNKLFFPDQPGAEFLTVKDIQLELGSDQAVKYTLNNQVIFNCSATQPNYSVMALKTGDADWNGALTAQKLNQTNYVAVYKQNIQGAGANGVTHGSDRGTIGLTNNIGNKYYIYSLTVTTPEFAALTAETMPAMKDAGDIQPVYTVPQGQELDLSEIDADVVWTDDNSSSDYIVKDGVLIVLKGGKAVNVKGIKNEQDFNTNVNTTNKVGAATDYPTTKFADDNMVVAKADTGFTVSFNPALEIVPGSLKYTQDGKDTPINTFVYDAKKGVSYTFDADLTKAVLSVEYAKLGDMATYTKISGAAIPDDLTTKKLKFMMNIPSIRAGKTSITLDSTTFEVPEKEITLLNVGALVIPKALLGTAKLAIPAGAEFDPTSAAATVTLNGNEAKNVPITVLSQATSKFSLANLVVNYNDGATDVTKYNEDISAVIYIQYQDGQGNIGYIYSDVISANYQAIYDLVAPQ